MPSPYLYGQPAAIDRLRAELLRARTTTRRWCGFGDSQETSPSGQGRFYTAEFNLALFSRFGKLGESLCAHPRSYGSGSPPANWLLRSNVNGTFVAADLADSAALPNHGSWGSAPSNINGWLVMLQPGHDSGDLYSAKRTVWDISQPLYATIFAHGRSDGSPEVTWSWEPTSSPTTNYFGPVVASGTTSTLDLANHDGAFRSETIGPFAIPPETPYPQLQLRGSTTDGAEIVGVRYFQTSDPGGIACQFFADGGYQVNSILTNHAGAGPMFAAFGPYSNVLLTFGANDGSNGKSAADFKAQAASLIAAVRGASWADDPDLLVTIIVDPVRTSTSSGTVESLDALMDDYVEAAKEIADDDAGVLVVNSRARLKALGWSLDGEPELYLSDNVHYTGLGGFAKAQADASILMSARSPAAGLNTFGLDNSFGL